MFHPHVNPTQPVILAKKSYCVSWHSLNEHEISCLPFFLIKKIFEIAFGVEYL